MNEFLPILSFPLSLQVLHPICFAYTTPFARRLLVIGSKFYSRKTQFEHARMHLKMPVSIRKQSSRAVHEQRTTSISIKTWHWNRIMHFVSVYAHLWRIFTKWISDEFLHVQNIFHCQLIFTHWLNQWIWYNLANFTQNHNSFISLTNVNRPETHSNR